MEHTGIPLPHYYSLSHTPKSQVSSNSLFCTSFYTPTIPAPKDIFPAVVVNNKSQQQVQAGATGAQL